MLEALDDLGNLIERRTIGPAPAAPLSAVDSAQVALIVGPLVPDFDFVFIQVANVGVTTQKPKEFVHDGFEVHFFGGEKGEGLRQVKPHLVAKNRQSASARAIVSFHTLIENFFHKIVIGFHSDGELLTSLRPLSRPNARGCTLSSAKTFAKN